jgi:hypothetical protein
MNSLLIAFLVSICVLLLVAAGVAHHIRLQHARLRDEELLRGDDVDEDSDSELL